MEDGTGLVMFSEEELRQRMWPSSADGTLEEERV